MASINPANTRARLLGVVLAAVVVETFGRPRINIEAFFLVVASFFIPVL